MGNPKLHINLFFKFYVQNICISKICIFTLRRKNALLVALKTANTMKCLNHTNAKYKSLIINDLYKWGG
jgi:hypothetical protein